MKKEDEWKVSRSISKTISRTIKGLPVFTLVWLPIAIKWDIRPAWYTLVPLLVAFALVALWIALLKLTEGQAEDYEDGLYWAERTSERCKQGLLQIQEALAMPDELLLKHVRIVEIESIALEINGFYDLEGTRVDTEPLDFSALNRSGAITAVQIRAMLEKNQHKLASELSNIKWPSEPPRVAKWRQRFAPRDINAVQA